MKKRVVIAALLFCSIMGLAQNGEPDRLKIKEDLDALLENISNRYVYFEDKAVDFDCIRETYTANIATLKTQADVILFFEFLLNEFYDSHISLSTNIRESYRLSAPIFVEQKANKVIITNVWQTQIKNLDRDILGAQILRFNGVAIDQMIVDFPTVCNDKIALEVRNWIANKIIAGKYSEARVLTLLLKSGEKIQFDLDALEFNQNDGLLSARIENEIAIVRFNNSLGNNQLIGRFDKTLDTLMNTKGMILDLRNTNNGGNTYVAKGIMGRFVDWELPYQKHLYTESYDGQPEITRSWLEYVSPRGKQYKKPVVILVGRWTGSMGEGMAIGFDAMGRAEIIGTKMKRLAGSDFDFRFYHQNFGYKMILERLFHVDGTPREDFVPSNYVTQSTIETDEILAKGLEVLRSKQ